MKGVLPNEKFTQYTDSARAGEVLVWRQNETRYVRKVQLTPPSRSWNAASIQEWYAVMTGQTLPASAIKTCSAHTAGVKQVHFDVRPGTPAAQVDFESFTVNCVMTLTGRPASTVEMAEYI